MDYNPTHSVNRIRFDHKIIRTGESKDKEQEKERQRERERDNGKQETAAAVAAAALLRMQMSKHPIFRHRKALHWPFLNIGCTLICYRHFHLSVYHRFISISISILIEFASEISFFVNFTVRFFLPFSCS